MAHEKLWTALKEWLCHNIRLPWYNVVVHNLYIRQQITVRAGYIEENDFQVAKVSDKMIFYFAFSLSCMQNRKREKWDLIQIMVYSQEITI